MLYRSGSQIREDFLRFFETKGHRRVHSSSLVPANDPTLLFTNAGMNQFKDVFLGLERREYSRAVSSQKCVRAGGKHNDLENVGFTRRHHTFFEMLGNFSFGDYFKREAIAYAWELLTSEQWFGIDPSRLYVTIFAGDASVPRDDDAERLWIETGVPHERIFAMPGKDNFWQMGETGPCGPCSEIFYDLGVAASESGEDKPFPEDDQRYIEIWNLVFMQFDRASDGGLTPLPRPSIDTGMGLERIACVLQGVLSNYQTDSFVPLIQEAAEATGFDFIDALGFEQKLALVQNTGEYLSGTWNFLALLEGRELASLRVIADHARAATFLIADGIEPANEGRGYVLRKILRRAIRHGRLLGKLDPFLTGVSHCVCDEEKAAYPELALSMGRIRQVILAEEQQFGRVLVVGASKLQEAIEASDARSTMERIGEYSLRVSYIPDESALAYATVALSKSRRHAEPLEVAADLFTTELAPGLLRYLEKSRSCLSGEDAFRLYETYGLPIDFISDATRDAGLDIDLAGFEAAKDREQARARASWKGGSQKSASPVFRELPKTEFEGYSTLRVEGARVLALVRDGLGIDQLRAGERGEAVLDATSFYADSGGQVGDIGVLLAADHQTVLADVQGCTKPVQGVFAHKLIARQSLRVNDLVDTVVDTGYRAATTRNHTGTHLLHAALREVLGTHVKQAGSLVNPARLRFDFSHFAGVAEEELAQIESIVNDQVLANTPVQTFVDVPIDEAVNDLHATALFGEKYGDRVRVVKIGDFSTELCGGIHTGATGEIGLVKLIGESSVASGVRRVEAVTGTGALEEFRRDFDVARVVDSLGTSDGSPAEALRSRLMGQDDEIRKLRRELDQMRLKAASAAVSSSAGDAVEVKGIKLLSQRVEALDKSQMRDLVDQLRAKLGSGVVVLGAANEGRVSLIVGVTKDLTERVQAGRLVAGLAPLVGGKGGGRPDLAEAGGTNVAALDGALGQAATMLGKLLE